MTLLNYATRELRDVQRYALEATERAVYDAKGAPVCVVLGLPVGAGKSEVGNALAEWGAANEKRAYYTVPNGDLQRQVQTDYRRLASLWSADTYRCPFQQQRKCVSVKKRCGVCVQEEAVARAACGPSLMNLHTRIGYRNKLPHPDMLIVDEAHKLFDFQLALVGKKLWAHTHHYPRDVATEEDLLAWIDMKVRTAPTPFFKSVQAMMRDPRFKVILERDFELHRGKEKERILVKPLTARFAPPVLYPPAKVRTLVLMSATINRKTIYETGVDRFYKHVVYVETPSPIPHVVRPVIVMPTVDMSMSNQHVGLPRLATVIERLLQENVGSGFIHMTYGDAEKLRPLLTHPRLMWHDKDTKSTQLEEFLRRAGSGAVLIGSGMREGIDLYGSKARWQVITKINFPNLGDPWTALKADGDPEWYDAQAVQDLLQSVGRVCRGPDDYGATYILDSRFERLFREREYLFPLWFREALRWPKESR